MLGQSVGARAGARTGGARVQRLDAARGALLRGAACRAVLSVAGIAAARRRAPTPSPADATALLADD